MGRPPKYSTPEQRADAQKAQKSVWYHSRKLIISRRRKRSRQRDAIAAQGSVGDIRPCENNKELLATTIRSRIQSSLRNTPPAELVEDACMFWQRELDSIMQCDFRSWGDSLLNEILGTSDEDGTAQLEFSGLINDFELLETLGDEISRNAFVLDPSGRDNIYAEAMRVSKTIQSLSNSLGEMLILRRSISGAHLLSEAKRSGSLIYQAL